MKHSTKGILTSHAGSLPKPPRLFEMLRERVTGKPVNTEALAMEVRQGVALSVKKQTDNGVTVPNDGEQGKTSWTDYVSERLNGYVRENAPAPANALQREFPEYYAQRNQGRGEGGLFRWVGNGALSWKDFGAVETDITNFKAALKNVKAEEGFLTALAPTQLLTRANPHYKNADDYLHAAGDVMNREYKAIVDAGIVLQLDAVLLNANQIGGSSDVQAQRKELARLIEGINYATKGIPADMIRLHACWGRTEGPKNNDPEIKNLTDILLQARVGCLSVASANGRHVYEWKAWKDVKLTPGYIILPGVMDNTTNIIEHPETVAERLTNFASVVGRENVIAGNDCGFGDAPWISPTSDVEPRVTWAKFKAMADGAALASQRLWKK